MAALLEKENSLSREKVEEVDGIIAKSILKFVPKLIKDVNETLIHEDRSYLFSYPPTTDVRIKYCDLEGGDQALVKTLNETYNEETNYFQKIKDKLAEYHSWRNSNKKLISEEPYNSNLAEDLQDMSYTQINTELGHLRSRLDDYKNFLREFENTSQKRDTYKSYYMNKNKRNDILSPKTAEMHNTNNDKNHFDDRAINEKVPTFSKTSPIKEKVYHEFNDVPTEKNSLNKSHSPHGSTSLDSIPKRYRKLDNVYYNRITALKKNTEERLRDMKERNRRDLMSTNSLYKSKSYCDLTSSKISPIESPIRPYDGKRPHSSQLESKLDESKNVMIPSSPLRRSKEDISPQKVVDKQRKVNFKEDLVEDPISVKTSISFKKKERTLKPSLYFPEEFEKPDYSSTPVQINAKQTKGKENILDSRDDLYPKRDMTEVKLIDEDLIDYRRANLEKQFRIRGSLEEVKMNENSKYKSIGEKPMEQKVGNTKTEKNINSKPSIYKIKGEIDIRSHDISSSRTNTASTINELNNHYRKDFADTTSTEALKTEGLIHLNSKYDVPSYHKHLGHSYRNEKQKENRHNLLLSAKTPLLDRTDYTSILSNFHKERKDNQNAERPFETQSPRQKQQQPPPPPSRLYDDSHYDVINMIKTERGHKDQSQNKSNYKKDKTSSDVLNYTEILEEINKLLKMTERKNPSLGIDKGKGETPISVRVPKFSKILNDINELKNLLERRQNFEYLLDEDDRDNISSISGSLCNSYDVEERLTADCIEDIEVCDLLTDKNLESSNFQKERIDKSFQFPDNQLDDLSKPDCDIVFERQSKDKGIDVSCQFPDVIDQQNLNCILEDDIEAPNITQSLTDLEENSNNLNTEEIEIDESLIGEQIIDESCQFPDTVDGEEFSRIDPPVENPIQSKVDESCQFPEPIESEDMGGHQEESRKDRIEEDIINEEIVTESFEAPDFFNFITNDALSDDSSSTNSTNLNEVIIDVNQDEGRENKPVSYYTEVRFCLKNNYNERSKAVQTDCEIFDSSRQDSLSSNLENDHDECDEKEDGEKFSNVQYVTIYDDESSKIKVKMQDFWLSLIPVQLKIPLDQSA